MIEIHYNILIFILNGHSKPIDWHSVSGCIFHPFWYHVICNTHTVANVLSFYNAHHSYLVTLPYVTAIECLLGCM